MQVLERTRELRFVQHDGLGVSRDEFADEAEFEVVRKDRLERGLELGSHRLTVEKLRHGVGEGDGLHAAHDMCACARGNGTPALIVKIEIPSKGVWDASVVTASGACVARWSQKAPAKFWMPPNAAPLEWGGKHFGEVAVEPGGNKGQRCQPPGQAIHAKGPTQDVVFAEDFNSKRNDLKLLGMKIMIFSCFTLNLCALFPLCAADGEPYEALFKTFGGTEIGGYKIEKHRECCDPSDNSLPKTEAVVHFGSMTAEQRRLALVAIMQGAAGAAHPKEGGGGGGGGG